MPPAELCLRSALLVKTMLSCFENDKPSKVLTLALGVWRHDQWLEQAGLRQVARTSCCHQRFDELPLQCKRGVDLFRPSQKEQPPPTEC